VCVSTHPLRKHVVRSVRSTKRRTSMYQLLMCLIGVVLGSKGLFESLDLVFHRILCGIHARQLVHNHAPTIVSRHNHIRIWRKSAVETDVSTYINTHVCLYIYIHAHRRDRRVILYVYMCIHTYVHICIYTSGYIYIYIQVNICIDVCVYIYVYINAHRRDRRNILHTYIYIHICVCIYIYEYIYIYV